MRTIYRVHQRDNLKMGMYCDTTAMSQMQESVRHPMPREDARLCNAMDIGCISYNSGWLFGFKDLDQLRSWVYKTEWRRALEAAGYVISEIHSDTVRVGDTQAVFHRVGHYEVASVISWEELEQ